MEQEAHVPPLLEKVEVVLVLLLVLVASITWLFWELFSFVNRESDDNGDWWEELKNCNHRRLIIPPECVLEVVEPGALSRLTSATSDAVKKMTGVVSSGLQRTGNLITRSANKPLSKAHKKGSRHDLASMDGKGGGGGKEGGRRRGSRSSNNLTAEGGAAVVGGGGGGGVRSRPPSRIDLSEELAGEHKELAATSCTSSSRPPKRQAGSKEGSHNRRPSKSDVVLGPQPPPPPPVFDDGGSISRDAAAALFTAPSAGGLSDPHMAVLADEQGDPPSPPLIAASLVLPEGKEVVVALPPPPTAPVQAVVGGPHGGGGGTNSNGQGGGGKPLLVRPLPDDCTPLLTFVNSRSGLAQGTYLIHQLRRLLNPIQVVDLAVEEPHRALRQFLELPRLRVLVCGGDGTAKWIMNVLEELQIDCWPPIAILPLGTGNDMARVLGWGGGYNNESIVEFLAHVQRAHVVVVDRWEMSVTTGKGRSEKSRVTTFNNYFGIGVDAQAALKFHHMREQKPQLFFSRLVNKMWYGFLGAQDLWKRSCVNLPQSVKVVVDGKEIELPPSVQGLMFLNIGSWGGGVKLWHEDEVDKDGGGSAAATDPVYYSHHHSSSSSSLGGLSSHHHHQTASMQDGLLELVAVNGVVHLGQLQVGLSKAVKICQCSEVTITTARDLPMQVDGEPWGQPKGAIKITRKQDPAYMLKRTTDTGGAVATEMSELLDWAQSTGVISIQQKKSLLTEFSRRVEHRRRTFEHENGLEGGAANKNYEMGRKLAARADLHRPNHCTIA